MQQLTPRQGWTGNGSESIRVSLVAISYTDYFGNPAYSARVGIDGHRSKGWADYIVNLHLLGGGIVDGATRGKAFWNPDSRILEIELTQYINGARIGKVTNVSFQLTTNGVVELDVNTEQAHAPKSRHRDLTRSVSVAGTR